MGKGAFFNRRTLPWLLLAPQLAISFVFFFWPSAQALWQSTQLQGPFGLSSKFAGFSNFLDLFSDPSYLASFRQTAIFSALVVLVGLTVSLLLAAMADRVVRAAGFYKTMLILPYAVATAVAGVMWLFLLSPTVGVVASYLQGLGIEWNPRLNAWDAMILVVLVSVWQQISYNFLFFLAGMQSVPRSLVEAAAIDGAGPIRRFWTIVFPMLAPMTFFLLVMNFIYAFFNTFAVIDVMTKGGPGQATDILVYRVYNAAFNGLNFGSSAAQSVVLMLIVIGLTLLQFRYLERRVHYSN